MGCPPQHLSYTTVSQKTRTAQLVVAATSAPLITQQLTPVIAARRASSKYPSGKKRLIRPQHPFAPGAEEMSQEAEGCGGGRAPTGKQLIS